jgi:hypothetical protein
VQRGRVARQNRDIEVEPGLNRERAPLRNPTLLRRVSSSCMGICRDPR